MDGPSAILRRIRARVAGASDPARQPLDLTPEPMPSDVRQANVPGWPRRKPAVTPPGADAGPNQPLADLARLPRPGLPLGLQGSALQRSGPEHGPAARTGPGIGSGSLGESADRNAARYAPVGAFLEVADVQRPILTVSMSGVSVRWDPAELPALGSLVEGDLATAPAGRPFRASFQVVRVEPDTGVVAGRFAGLSGNAIDRLLGWLVDLDRIAAGSDGRPR